MKESFSSIFFSHTLVILVFLFFWAAFSQKAVDGCFLGWGVGVGSKK